MAAEVEWAYLAGLVDADGTICLTKPRKHYNSHQLSVRVSNTDKGLISWLRNIFGGTIAFHKRKKNSQKHADAFSWGLFGTKLDVLLEKIYPYLQRKKFQAVVALDFRRTLRRAGRKRISEQVSKYRDVLCNEMQRLNRKGPK